MECISLTPLALGRLPLALARAGRLAPFRLPRSRSLSLLRRWLLRWLPLTLRSSLRLSSSLPLGSSFGSSLGLPSRLGLALGRRLLLRDDCREGKRPVSPPVFGRMTASEVVLGRGGLLLTLTSTPTAPALSEVVPEIEVGPSPLSPPPSSAPPSAAPSPPPSALASASAPAAPPASASCRRVLAAPALVLVLRLAAALP